MNYRHAYHAGNFADVMKHAVLTLVVEALKRKATPFFVLDTHAGLGAYDLMSEAAGKTGEYLGGIARVLEQPDPPAALETYLRLIRSWNHGGGLRRYPGSPEVARALMRPTDRLALVELHPEDVGVLRQRFAGDRRVGVHHLDGHVAAKALLPPAERRGLVLIDPPFEARDELDRLRQTLRRIRRLWPGGIVLVWYPVKDRGAVGRFHRALAEEGGSPTLAAEVLIHPDDDPFRLNGSGLVVVNSPLAAGRDPGHPAAVAGRGDGARPGPPPSRLADRREGRLAFSSRGWGETPNATPASSYPFPPIPFMGILGQISGMDAGTARGTS